MAVLLLGALARAQGVAGAAHCADAPAGVVCTDTAGWDAAALAPLRALLGGHGLQLQLVADGAAIPGSYWGEPEAGIIGSTVYARADTPVHSLLHEACHLIVLPPQQRALVHTDATDSVEEEDAVLVLQVLLAGQLPGVGRDRLLADMDRWGYTFRLGSARAYLEHDAAEAFAWLAARGLLPGALAA